MDDQTAERTAKVATDNLRLRDEVKLLRRQLTRAVPVGVPVSDPNQAPVALARVADLEAIADERLGELEALQKRYDQLREEWMAEHGAALVLRAKVEELQPVQHGDVTVDTRPVHVAALMAEVEMLRTSQGSAARHLLDDLRALRAVHDDLEIRERHQGRDLVNVQAAYANLLGTKNHWRRDMWISMFMHEMRLRAGDADTARTDRDMSAGCADKALDLVDDRFGPQPLDTPEDTDEG